MERRIAKKVNHYLSNFKEEIKELLITSKGSISDILESWDGEDIDTMDTLKNSINEELMSLLQQIYDYENIALVKEDFAKRKRVKNVVPFFDRCVACRANGEQCTRRKKEGSEFCGTHIKGTPHGVIKEHNTSENVEKKISIWVCDIKGIMYYLDNNNNVYDSEEVMLNKKNPKIIAKYEKKMVDGEPVYSIPQFNI